MLRRNDLYWADLTGAGINPSTVSRQCVVELQDARQLQLCDGQLDLIVTSPPYATCYQYLELHQLTQLWFERHQIIDSKDLRHACIGGKGISTRESGDPNSSRSEEHTSELQSRGHLVCRLLLEKKKI